MLEGNCQMVGSDIVGTNTAPLVHGNQRKRIRRIPLLILTSRYGCIGDRFSAEQLSAQQ